MNAYLRAVKEITDRRRADLDDGLLLWKQALSNNNALNTAFVAYQNAAIAKAQGLTADVDGARAELDKQTSLAGIKKESITPPPHCKLCDDTGYTDGKYCGCVIKRVIESERDNLVLPRYDFSAMKQTAPKSIVKLYDAAQKYIADEHNEKPFFIIFGSSGTGKTVLAAAMANEMLLRGMSAVTISAFEFTKRAKDYHTQFAAEDYRDLFTPMLDCDFLAIDDLGTETILKNISREYFYTVINERWLRKKCTVVTTNLSPAQLLERYGEAIFSRLCDKSIATMFSVAAKNARIE